MSRASITIDRDSLGKADLVIASDGTTFKLTEDGVGYVVQSVRVTTAPDSVNVDGSEITGFARNATGLTIEFNVIGTTSADLDAAVAELEEAFYRLAYPVTRQLDGISKTYTGGPCALVPKRAVVDSAIAAAHFDTFGVTIPFSNPNGA